MGVEEVEYDHERTLVDAQLHAVGLVGAVLQCDSADGDEERNVLLEAVSPTAMVHMAGVGDKGLVGELEALEARLDPLPLGT